MRIEEEGKKNLTNIRVFKYRGKVHIVSEIKDDIKGFLGCYRKIQGVKCCLINANLSYIKKQMVLHRLIKDRHLTRR